MVNKINNNKGNSLVELIMVMMLLVLFGVTIYTIIYSGTSAQERIINNKDSQIDARVALSFVNLKIRQNDKQGGIKVAVNPINDKDALLIQVRPEFEDAYDLWVFADENVVYEFIGLEGELPSIELSNVVLEATGLDYQVSYDADSNIITNTIVYDYGAKEQTENRSKTISSSIKLRSAVEVGVDGEF